VSGAVTVDGKPLEVGSIQFTPVDGKTPVTGGAIQGGNYSVRVHVGTIKVSISAPKVVGQKKVYDAPDSPVRPLTAESLPERYNEKSELKLEVKSGRNPKDWALESKK